MAGKNRANGHPKSGYTDGGPADSRNWRRAVLSRLQIRRQFSKECEGSVFYADYSPAAHAVEETNLAVAREAALEAAVDRLKEGTEQLQQAEARYRIISELISDFAYVAHLEPGGRFVIEWISEGASRIFGYPLDQLATSDQWMAIIHPDDRQVAMNNLARAAEGQTVADEIRYLRPDGTILWLSISARPVVNPDTGKVGKIFGAGQDITERKLAEEALSQSQARYRALFNESPVPLWEVDLSRVKANLAKLTSEGVRDVEAYYAVHQEEARALLDQVRIYDVNGAAMRLYNKVAQDELADFVGGMIRDDVQLMLDGVAAMAQGRSFFDLRGRDTRAGHGPRYFELYLSVVHGFEQNYGRVIVSMLDFTGRHLAEQALRLEARRLALINAITTTALSLKDFKSTLLELAEQMRDFGGADGCLITRWDAEHGIPLLLAGTGDLEQRAQGQFIAPGEANITRTVLEAGHVVVARPDDAASLNQRIAPIFHHGAAIAMPLQVGKEKIGAAVLIYKHTPILTDEERDLWEKVAAQVSLAIASLQHFERARRRAEELEKIERVSSELRQAQAYKEVLDITVREMVQMVDAERGGLILKREGKWALEFEKSEKNKFDSSIYPLNEAIVQGIMQQAQKMLYADPETGIIIRNCPWQQGLNALTVIPIKSSETTIGLVVLGWQRRRELMPGDQILLTAIAEMAGNALQRASIVETLEQRVADRTRDLQILYNLSALSHDPQGLKKLMHSALKQLIKVLDGEAGAFYQLKAKEPVLEISFSLGIPGAALPFIDHIPIDLEQLPAIEQNQQPFMIPDIRTLPYNTEALVKRGCEALIWIPIRVSGHLCGVLCIAGKAGKLNLEEKSLVMAVADLVATANENARLQKRSKDAAVMEERQRLARALHDSVTQSLYSLTLFTEAGREHSAAGNQERALHYLERSAETAQGALREMRMLLYELRPPELARLGLIEALRYRLEAVERRIGMEVNLSVKHSIPIAPELEEALFWIAQEALNNVLRHADATKVSVNLDIEPRWISLEIVDNGCGFEAGMQPPGGMGLVGMHERARKIGAQLEVSSMPGCGTRIEVKLQSESFRRQKSGHG